MKRLTCTRKIPKIGIVVFPGSNCDRDVYHVLQNLLKIRTEFIWHTKSKISGYDALIIPGGFSYGDRLRAGIIAAYSPIMSEVKRLAKEGIPILGICNGFQILVESCLLPGGLIRNSSLGFVCQWTDIKVANNKTPFTNLFSQNQEVAIPVAHGEGRYVLEHDALRVLKKNNQIVFKYAKDNPNGSADLIAGICNEEGNVVGMMPHPERASEIILSPNKSGSAALFVFHSLLSYLSNKETTASHKRPI